MLDYKQYRADAVSAADYHHHNNNNSNNNDDDNTARIDLESSNTNTHTNKGKSTFRLLLFEFPLLFEPE